MSTLNMMSSTDDKNNKQNDPLIIWRGLTLRVSQEPANIKLHTQRVLYCLENNLSDFTSGALQDLFVCLRQKGLPLRQRLFNLASPVMVQTDRAYFQRWLADGSDKNLDCYRYSGAVFSSDTCRSVDGVSDANNLNGVKPKFANQLLEARHNIEIGQIVKAQALLENICIKDDNNIEVINELQRLYNSTKSQEALERFTQRLGDNGKPLPEIWQNFVHTARSW